MLREYLQRLGFSDKECAIYLVLAEVGVQPASIIARRSGLDRVTTYKHLKKLSERGFVRVYFRDNVQCFGVESFESIEAYLKDQSKEYQDLLGRFPIASNLLRSLREGEDLIPRLQLFEREAGIKSLFRDMLFEIKQENVRQIRMLSSNTFADNVGGQMLETIGREFLRDIARMHVDVDLFEVTGALVPERIRHIPAREIDASTLPVLHGSTNIFVVGRIVYLAFSKQNQIGLKIKQAEVSQIFHFLFDLLRKAQE